MLVKRETGGTVGMVRRVPSTVNQFGYGIVKKLPAGNQFSYGIVKKPSTGNQFVYGIIKKLPAGNQFNYVIVEIQSWARDIFFASHKETTQKCTRTTYWGFRDT